MTSVTVPYLGRAGALQPLPLPNDAMPTPASDGVTIHSLASGGSAVTRRLNVKRTWQLPYSYLEDDDAALISGFHERLYGSGPWVLVDPTVRNVLPLDVSTCGVRTAAAHGWVASTGTLTRTGTAPDDAASSGVLQWSSSAANATLQPDVSAGATDGRVTLPAWLPSEFCAASVYVQASSAVSMSLILVGCDATGAPLVSTLLHTFTSSTGWQRVAVVAEPAEPAFVSAGVVLVVPQLKIGATVPTTVSIAAGQVEYADTANGWLRGYGSPRVVCTDTPGRSVGQVGFQDLTLNLAEI